MESPGSSASADVSASPVQEQVQRPPVLEERKSMKVMVAVDDSEEGFYALHWALDMLFPVGLTSEAQPEELSEEPGMISVVHVMYPFQPYVLPAGPAIFATTSMIDSIRKAQRQNATELLSRALQFCKHRLIKVETLILEGDPKDMICQAAEEMHVDLLVVGSRGLGKVKRAFLGSVSDYCAHQAKCPVLIVKPSKLSH